MRYQGPFIWQIRALVFTGLIGWIVWGNFNEREAALRSGQQQFVAAQKDVYAKEDLQRAMTAQQQAVERKNAYQKEMLELLGPVDQATKDPSLNLRQMIEQTAFAFAPPDTSVRVTVDRFTDFDVVMILQDTQPSAAVAEISKNLIKKTLPYIHSVRFFQADKLLAELDDRDIQSVTNWSSVSTDWIEGILLAKDKQDEPAPSISTEASASSENNATPDQIKINEAQETWEKHLHEHWLFVTALSSNLFKAARLENIQTQARFQSQIAFIDQAGSKLSAERDYFMQPTSELEQLLVNKDLDPLLVSIIKRNADQRYSERLILFANAFDALEGFRQETRNFLVSMDGVRKDWALDQHDRTIHFQTGAARDTYTFGSSRLQQKAEAFQQACERFADLKSQE